MLQCLREHPGHILAKHRVFSCDCSEDLVLRGARSLGLDNFASITISVISLITAQLRTKPSALDGQRGTRNEERSYPVLNDINLRCLVLYASFIPVIRTYR